MVESGADPNIPDEVKHFLPSRRQLQLLKGYFSTGVNKMWILAIGRVLDVTVTPREIEPLVCEYYISKCPVIVPYHRGGKRIHVGVQELTISLKILLHGLKLLLASSSH